MRPRVPTKPSSCAINGATHMKVRNQKLLLSLLVGVAALAAASSQAFAQQQQKRPNIVMLMTDDTGWNAAVPLLDIRRRILTGSQRKVRRSRIGMVKLVAPRAALHSSPVASRSVRRFPLWSPPATRTR